MPCLQILTKYAISFPLLLTVINVWSASEADAGSFNQTKWQQYNVVVQQASRQYQIDPRLVHAVLWQESNYDSKAVSSAGAMGLMQLMPRTARELGVWHPFSPRENIDGGVRYLTIQLKRFRTVKRALQAYHCGPTCVAEGRVPLISIRYANQVIARYRHIKRTIPITTRKYGSLFVAYHDRFRK